MCNFAAVIAVKGDSVLLPITLNKQLSNCKQWTCIHFGIFVHFYICTYMLSVNSALSLITPCSKTMSLFVNTEFMHFVHFVNISTGFKFF